jgi:hypothetical protein
VRREELDLGNLRLLRGDPGSGCLWLLLLLEDFWLRSMDLLDSEEVDFLRGEALSRGRDLSLSLSLLGVLGFLSALEKSRI